MKWFVMTFWQNARIFPVKVPNNHDVVILFWNGGSRIHPVSYWVVLTVVLFPDANSSLIGSFITVGRPVC
jgi:hypothetical protein